MALRDKLATQAAPSLRDGETVQHTFAAIATSPYWSLLSYWIIIVKDANRAVVVTDQRIIVFRTSRWRFTKFRNIERELPRSTAIGQPEGLNWKTDDFGEPLWINKRFHKDVNAARESAPSGD